MIKTLTRRFRTTAVLFAAGATLALPLTAIPLVVGTPSAQAATALPPTTPGGLVVSTSYTSTAPNGPKQGDLLGSRMSGQPASSTTHYKWLINQDTSGNAHFANTNPNVGKPGMDSAGNPIAALTGDQIADAICHPLTPTNKNGNPNYPGVDPRYGQACKWASVATLGSDPVVSSGTDADWNAKTALPLWDLYKNPDGTSSYHGIKEGTYLVSVLANGYQLGGSSFKVVRINQSATPTPNTATALFDAAGNARAANLKIVGLTPLVNPTAGAKLDASNAVAVNLNPWPLPLATMRLQVYADMASANSQWDEQTEGGIPGFEAHLTDYDGSVTVDYYGNPLCTQYLYNSYVGSTPGDPTTGDHLKPNGEMILGPDGNPIVDRTVHWFGTNIVPGPSLGKCLSDASGEIIVPNLAPGRYGTSVIAATGNPNAKPMGTNPPPISETQQLNVANLPASTVPTPPGVLPDGSNAEGPLCPTQNTSTASSASGAGIHLPDYPCWVQTDTLEGQHDIDVWLQANDTGLDTEMTVGGEVIPWVRYGFVLAGCAPSDPTKYARGLNFYGNFPHSTWTNPASCLQDSTNPALGGKFPYQSLSHGADTTVLTGRVTGQNGYIPGVASGLQGTSAQTNGQGDFKLEPQPADENCKDIPVAAGAAQTAARNGCQYLKHAWVAMSNLNGNDLTTYVMPANPDGTFAIHNVPAGSYSLAFWDQPEDYIFDSVNVTVTDQEVANYQAHGTTTDVGTLPLLSWFTRIYGHVFLDLNGNGRQDPGEPGVPKFLMQNLDRTNNMYEQGQNTSTTDTNGYYEFTDAYPLGAMNVAQFFNTRYKTTGVTYQACNDPQEHTVLTPAVDISVQPNISQCGRLDIGIQPYAPAKGDNGGIVATVQYASLRAHYLARQTNQMDYFPGIPGVTTQLFKAVKGVGPGGSNDQGYAINTDGSYVACVPTSASNNACANVNPDGSLQPTSFGTATLANGTPNVYVSENWDKQQPSGAPNAATPCIARDANGNIIQGRHDQTSGKPTSGQVTGVVENGNGGAGLVGVTPGAGTINEVSGGNTFQSALPGLDPNGKQACIEAPQTGLNFVLGTDNNPVDPSNPGAGLHGYQTVDGNYTLTPGHADPTTGAFTQDTGDYLARVVIPGDTVLPPVDGAPRPLYKVVTEQDLNVFGPTTLAAANGNGPSVPRFIPQAYPVPGSPSTYPVSCPHSDCIDWPNSWTVTRTAADTTNGTLKSSATGFKFPPAVDTSANDTDAPRATPPVFRNNMPAADPTNPEAIGETVPTYSPSPDVQCAGATFVVDTSGNGTNIPGRNFGTATTPERRARANASQPNYAFRAAGGSTLNGSTRNLCDVHLLHVAAGQSVAPNFEVYTDVPIPAKYQVQIFDDTLVSKDPRSTQFGEAAPIPNAPIGVYDYHGNLVAPFCTAASLYHFLTLLQPV